MKHSFIIVGLIALLLSMSMSAEARARDITNDFNQAAGEAVNQYAEVAEDTRSELRQGGNATGQVARDDGKQGHDAIAQRRHHHRHRHHRRH